MLVSKKRMRALLGATAISMSSVAILAMAGAPTAAQAQQARSYDIPAQPLTSALQAFGRQSGLRVATDDTQIAGLRANPVSGAMTSEAALRRMLNGLGVQHQFVGDGAVVIRRTAGTAPVRPRQRVEMTSTSATVQPLATDPSAATLEEVIVTARRMQERIIDVPISVSAFSAQQLDDRKIEGGSELLRAIPNVSFSKDNFTGYNF